MKQLTFWSACLCLLFAACNNDDVTPCQTSNSGIYGSWDWVQSTYYFTANGPVVQTPATEGFTRRIELSTTSMAYFYKNEVLEDSSSFQIIDNQIAFDNHPTYYISADSCVLLLDLSYVDGAKEEYKCTCN